MSEEEMNWDIHWVQLELYPSTWPEVAQWVNDYMRLPCGRVVYDEVTEDRVVDVSPTLGETIYDLLHLHLPIMRQALVPTKFSVIKVLDEYGKTLVHATFVPESLCTFDQRRVMDLGRKFKRELEAK